MNIFVNLYKTPQLYLNLRISFIFPIYRVNPLSVLGGGRGRRCGLAGDGPANVPLPDERLEKLSATDAIRGSKGERQREEVV